MNRTCDRGIDADPARAYDFSKGFTAPRCCVGPDLWTRVTDAAPEGSLARSPFTRTTSGLPCQALRRPRPWSPGPRRGSGLKPPVSTYRANLEPCSICRRCGDPGIRSRPPPRRTSSSLSRRSSPAGGDPLGPCPIAQGEAKPPGRTLEDLPTDGRPGRVTHPRATAGPSPVATFRSMD